MVSEYYTVNFIKKRISNEQTWLLYIERRDIEDNLDNVYHREWLAFRKL